MKPDEAEESVDLILTAVDKNNSGSIDYTGINLIMRICNGHNR